MPILQNAKHVYISSSDFRDIHGNYYDYGNNSAANGNSSGARRGPTHVPVEHFRVAGQVRSAQGMTGPDGRQTIQDVDRAYLESVLGSMNGFTNFRQGAASDADQEIVNNVFNSFFSPQNGRTANTPVQNNMTGNSMYTGEAVNVPPPTPTQARQNPPTGGPNGNGASLQERVREWQAGGGNAANVSSQASPTSPRPNGPGTPFPPFAAPLDARTNSRGNSTFTFPSSFTLSSGSNTQPSRTPTLPTGGPENGQSQLNFQFPNPNTVSSPSQSYQFVHIPHMAVQPSPFPSNGNSTTQSFQSPPQSFRIPGNTNSNGNGQRSVNGSILLERPMTSSPLHDHAMLSQQGNASPAADAPPPEAVVNEALTKTPLEKRAGFLGF